MRRGFESIEYGMTGTPLKKILLSILLAAALPVSPCGTERWAVKVGTDQDASLIDTSKIHHTTIQHLVELPRPKRLPEAARVNATEKTVWEIKGEIIKFKPEADGDFHVVIVDPQGRTMIIELPDSDCLHGSPFNKLADAARKHFDERFPPTKSKRMRSLKKGVKATILGIGFFDKIHGQTGVAPNGMELHPVLKICFEGEDCRK